MTDLQLLIENSRKVRDNFYRQNTERRLDQAAAQQQQGTITGADVDLNLGGGAQWLVRLLNGSIISASSHTSSGFENGEAVVVVWDALGRATIDQKPGF
jgi:hypothetical protein